MSVAAGKLSKLLLSSNRLICIHGSSKAVANGPQVPPTPNLELMMSMEGDSYLWAVHEADTAEEAVALWGPGPAKPSQLKRLQQGPKRGKRRKGGFHSRGYGSTSGHGGKRGGCGGGRGSYRYTSTNHCK